MYTFVWPGPFSVIINTNYIINKYGRAKFGCNRTFFTFVISEAQRL